ncbi:hypothetical protein [Lachnospira sp.]|uniref:hypothetical protein n=1 Tax=Lachnospira sp. TaxID=2049031 RepID=UPI00257F3FCD|nr:hypothetical protein [Lachnospira sp.]
MLKATHNYNHKNDLQEYSDLNSYIRPSVVSEASAIGKLDIPEITMGPSYEGIKYPKPKNFDFGLNQD